MTEPISMMCEGSLTTSRGWCPMCALPWPKHLTIPEHNRLDIIAMIDRGDFNPPQAWNGACPMPSERTEPLNESDRNGVRLIGREPGGSWSVQCFRCPWAMTGCSSKSAAVNSWLRHDCRRHAE